MLEPRTLEQTKLVIWDLDDTFWQGTLTEGGIRYQQDFHDAVIRLAELGIMSSIASNNDHETVREVLSRHGLWEFFIFPAIHWGTKPEMVRAILANAQLRPANTLFLDDKLRIREAVATGVPDLLAVDTAEAFLPVFRAWSSGRVPSGAGLERLAHYKLLESKEEARSQFVAHGAGSAQDFLRASDVVCTVASITDGLFDRILELILRTNQLNYTQKRLSAEALRSLLSRPDVDCGAVSVRDRFGDYGVCGFYVLEKAPEPVLSHFLFSCRVLQMGVEEALYQWLGRPRIETAAGQQATAATLMARAPEVDWVKLVDARAQEPEAASQTAARSAATTRLLMVGPCELEILSAGLESYGRGLVEASAAVTFNADDGRIVRQFGHASWLRLAADPHLVDRWAEDLELLPWYHPSLVAPRLADGGGNQVMVLSSVRNAQSAVYRHVEGGFTVPFDYFGAMLGGIDLTNPDDQARAAFYIATTFNAPATEEMFARFCERYTFAGLLGGEEYEQCLRQLCERLPADGRLVVLTVPDMSRARMPLKDARVAEHFGRWQRHHQALNDAIARAARAAPEKMAVLDINAHVSEAFGFLGPKQPGPDETEPEQLFNWAYHRYYHFERQVYVNLGMDLLRQLKAWGMLSFEEEQVRERAQLAR